ncbi:hypothetical protein GCM10011514_35420 [Emticicia aquatilis]|uniref:Uncharacterized protein n=1 Tax=Emticicia aquatilis TaxID=1537369 RepID=A0A917DUK8_9BACT|nr:hypothetical protein GCM10011514_35420 [Emticicia aquatilis]
MLTTCEVGADDSFGSVVSCIGIFITTESMTLSFRQAKVHINKAEMQMMFFILLSYFVDTNVESLEKSKCRLDDQNRKEGI